MVFENHDLEDSFIINMATTTIQDYQKAMTNTQNKDYNNRDHDNTRNNNNHDTSRRNTTRSNQHLNQKWKKPRAGTIKANCDANLKIDGTWGLGAICRNEHGQVVASATWQRSGFNDPATAEAFALYLTMRFAADCCFTSVDFESDSLKVVNSVNSQDSNLRNYFGNLIRGIQLNLARFRRVSIKHIDRKANQAAHRLADLAHTSPNCIWLEDTHPLLVPIVLMDSF
jgi:ribonuclease HI